MVKHKIILILLLILSFGCEKVFKEDLENRLEIRNYDDFVLGLNGLYSINAKFLALYNNFFLTNGDDVVVTNLNNNGMISFCPQPAATWSTDQNLTIWQDLFRIISTANNLIVKSSSYVKEHSDSQKVLGEIYLIRALTYFRLVKYFGKVPIIDNVNVDYNVKLAEFDQIYDFIISDLHKALELLPDNNNDARVKFVTPHKGTIKALLAEVYLSRAGYPCKQTEMYAQAANMAKDVIENANYYGFHLMEDFNDLWESKKIYNNYEGIIMNYFQVMSFYYNIEIDANFLTYEDIRDQAGMVVPGLKFYNTYPDSYRKRMTYRTYQSIYFTNGNAPVKDSLPSSMDICSEILLRKWMHPFNSRSLNENEPRMIYPLRFAHTLLTYAEASARAGKMDDLSYQSFNQIRRRAHKLDLNAASAYDLTTGLSPEQFIDSVLVERSLEFCGETENRWFDLLRTEQFSMVPKLRFSRQGSKKLAVIDTTTFFIPIPASEIKLNSNLEQK